MNRLVQLFFPLHSALSLGRIRLLFFGLALVLFWKTSFQGVSSLDPVFWYPFSFFHLVDAPSLSITSAAALTILWKVSLALSAIGLISQISIPIAALLGTFLFGLRSGFGATIHSQCYFLLSCWIFAFARCSESFSLDARFFPIEKPQILAREKLGLYGWPIALLQFLFLWIYFSSAVSKLTQQGLAWATAENFSAILRYAGATYRWSSIGALNMGTHTWLLNQRPLLEILAPLALLTELLAPVAFFFRKAAPVTLVSLFLLNVGIWVFLYLNWTPMMLGFLFWLPWRELDGTDRAR